MMKKDKILLRISVKIISPTHRKVDVYPDNEIEEQMLDNSDLMFLIFFSIRRLWSLNN